MKLKALSLIPALLLGSNVFSAELHNFAEVKAAAAVGKPVHIVIDLMKCASPTPVQTEMLLSLTPTGMVIRGNEIVTSLTHFTLNNPVSPNKGVYEFVRYTISNDNVNLKTDLLDAVTYTKLREQHSFDCKIGSGVRFYS